MTCCKETGCDEKHYARGWCKKHYFQAYHYQWNAGVWPDSLPQLRTVSVGCKTLGCFRKHYARDWCYKCYKRHYNRHRKTGVWE